MKHSIPDLDLTFDEIKDLIKLTDKTMIDHKRQFELEYNRLQIKKNNLINALQSVCGHEKTFTKDDYNHHNGETWVEVYCELCGKYLSRS